MAIVHTRISNDIEDCVFCWTRCDNSRKETFACVVRLFARTCFLWSMTNELPFPSAAVLSSLPLKKNHKYLVHIFVLLGPKIFKKFSKLCAMFRFQTFRISRLELKVSRTIELRFNSAIIGNDSELQNRPRPIIAESSRSRTNCLYINSSFRIWKIFETLRILKEFLNSEQHKNIIITPNLEVQYISHNI